MSDNNKSSGFFDKNTILAMVLSFAVFFAWQAYVAKKYPKKPTITTEAPSKIESPETKNSDNGTVVQTQDKPNAKGASTTQATQVTESSLKYASPNVSFEISSNGMGFKNLTLNKYSDRKNNPIAYIQNETSPLLVTTINGESQFQISQSGENEFTGQLVSATTGLNISKKLVIDPDKYLIHTTIQITASSKVPVQVRSTIVGAIEDAKSSMFLPSYEHHETYVLEAAKTHRQNLSPSKPFKETYDNGKVAAFNSQYFALAMMNKSDLLPQVIAHSEGKAGGVEFSYVTPQPVDQQTLSYDFYFGPKEISTIRAASEELTSLIDYGFFAVIGKPLHAVLLFIYGLVSNWGIAIVILTIILRTALLPLNMYSFKSMRKMQTIQPKLTAIKEKYKNDPARINQETLQLMRAEKANPLSGCIPALLQIPIFFAFYAMIASSFEIYKQPFFFWIHDLTLKDPFFILPIAGSIVFFIQQKLTPPSPGMDPAQQKMLLFMPFFITIFMLGTPSGLSLYFFVNALCGFAQQMFFMKSRTT